MKAQLLGSFVVAFVTLCGAQTDSAQSRAGAPERQRTFSSFDVGKDTNGTMAAKSIRFTEADLNQVLAIYQDMSGRSLIRSPQLALNTKVTFENVTVLSRVEALQALDTVLASHGVVMVYLGTQYVKVVRAADASTEPGPIVEVAPEQLPESSSFLIYIVRLKRLTPEEAIPVMVPFAKLPNSLMGTSGSNVVMIRDY